MRSRHENSTKCVRFPKPACHGFKQPCGTYWFIAKSVEAVMCHIAWDLTAGSIPLITAPLRQSPLACIPYLIVLRAAYLSPQDCVNWSWSDSSILRIVYHNLFNPWALSRVKENSVLRHKLMHLSWIDYFSTKPQNKQPKWIDSQSWRVKIVSALVWIPMGSVQAPHTLSIYMHFRAFFLRQLWGSEPLK